MQEKDLEPAVRYLGKLLGRMSNIQRNVACLYYFENVSTGDIATILQEDESYIQEIFQQIMTKLSSELRKQSLPSSSTAKLSR